MSSQDFLIEYIEEVREHLQELEESLLIMERDGSENSEINRIFRAAHSIKGASAYMGFEQLAGLTHELESFMSAVQNDEQAITPEVITTLLACVDAISGALNYLQEHGEEPQLPPMLLENLQTLRSSSRSEDLPQDETTQSNTQKENQGNDTLQIDFSLDAEIPIEICDQREPGAKPPVVHSGPNEIIVEEDQELFSIFLSSFREQFAKLRDLSRKYEDKALPDEELHAVLDLIGKLLSSSQYMDYEVVVGHLQEMEADILRVHEEGGESGKHCAAVIENSARLFEEILPGLNLLAPEPVSSDPVAIHGLGEAIQEEDQELLHIFTDSFQQQMEELFRLAPKATDISMESHRLERARSILKKLSSSSQYMGYEPIVDILTEWDEVLEEADVKGVLSDAQFLKIFEHFRLPLQKLLPELQVSLIETLPTDPQQPDTIDSEIDASFDRLEAFSIPASESKETKPTNGEAISSEPEADQEIIPSAKESPSIEKTERKGRTAASGEEAQGAATLRVDAQKVDQLLNQVGELVVARSEFIQTSTSFREILRELTAQGKLSKQELRRLRQLSFRLNESTLSLGRVANDLQNSIMRVRMLPISYLFQRFPRVVRDQALKLGKRVDLIVQGADTEIDKRVLEQMHDPLVQFLRNAIAHGIEPPDERRRAGKTEGGTIRLAAYHEGDYVAIEIEDDGRGIDTRKLRETLLNRKGLSAEQLERLTDREMMYAIFLPGISTHGHVDGNAGRGVGLDVVKENLERMSGSIEVESQLGTGTRFTIRIPLTVAIIRALMVQGSDQSFAIPLSSVSEILRFEQDSVHTIESFQVITLRGKTIPLVHLGELLRISSPDSPSSHRFIVIVATSFREVGLVVDGLMGEREIVIKSIEDSAYDYEGFSGATILGDGTVSLILDVSALLRMMKQSQKQDSVEIERLSINENTMRVH